MAVMATKKLLRKHGKHSPLALQAKHTATLGSHEVRKSGVVMVDGPTMTGAPGGGASPARAKPLPHTAYD